MRLLSEEGFDESRDSCGWSGDPAQRRDRRPTEADGRDWRATDLVAHHEDLLAARHQRLRHLLWLQGLHDQGVFCQLLPSYVGRDLRHACESHGGAPECRGTLARDPGRYRRPLRDRWTVEKNCTLRPWRRSFLY